MNILLNDVLPPLAGMLLGLVLLWFMLRPAFAAEPIVTAPAPSRVDIEKMIQMVKVVEGWDGHSRGRQGERGPWQMKPAVWAQYSRSPIPTTAEGWRGIVARHVVEAHARWILGRMQSSGIADIPYNFALIWKAGYAAVLHRRFSEADADYARRAAQIYDSFTQ